MIVSPYPLERLLGMKYYGSDAEGIGGVLRLEPSDFIVNEIPPARPVTSGPFLICRLEKTNWEHHHAIREIAKRLGISHRRIGWAGTKDRNAVTSQYLSLYRVTAEQVSALRLRDLSVVPVGESNEGLSLGELAGNRFTVTIRDCQPHDLEGRVIQTVATARDAVPNYFGIQRFGGVRPVTHRVGECILKGDYEGAVMTYIGDATGKESGETGSVRRAFTETRDIRAALVAFPPQMSYERAMLHFLQTHPGDYAGALHELPPRLLSMFVSAFQSLIFNQALSCRLDDGHTLADPLPGDPLLFANGRTDTAGASNLAAASTHIRRGRCTIALFMPGRDPVDAPGEGARATGSLLGGYGITAEDYRRASAFVRTKFEGAWRPIALRSDLSASVSGTSVRLEFTLPPGQYATTVCREFMKADPACMV